MSLDFCHVSSSGSLPDIGSLVDSENLAFDMEGSGVNMGKDVPYGFSLACSDTDAYYTTMHNRMFLDLLADENRIKIAHNASYDRSMLKKAGVTVDNLCDTMIAAHLLEAQPLNLRSLCGRFITEYDMHVPVFEELTKDMKYMALGEMAGYSGPHSVGAFVLWQKLQRELRYNLLWDVFWKVEMPFVPVLSDMELNGCLIDTQALEELGKYYDDKIGILEEGLNFYAEHKINWNSADQVAKVMYEQFKVPKPPAYTNTQKGRPSVEKEYLEPHRSRFPIVNPYLSYKAYRHLKDTYVTGILRRLVNGRIHTSFNQTRTRTGRLSSSNPNLQNIPLRSEEGRKIRKSFISPDGKKLMKSDYEQVELKKMAILSGCKALIDAFKAGRDIHEETAIRAYGDKKYRFKGKTLNFKLIYGGGTEEEQALLFTIYPEVKTWTNKMRRQFEIMQSVRTMYGRKRTLGNILEMSPRDAAHACREGISTIDQGSCAEVCKIGMKKVWDKTHTSPDIKMLLQVHDEVIWEVPDEQVPWMAELIRNEMRYDGLAIPLTVSVSVGQNWSEMQDVKEM